MAQNNKHQQAKRKLNKTMLHPRNRHNNGYDFDALTIANPELAPLVKLNQYGNQSIDFADPLAVKALNKALLIKDYRIEYWDISAQSLCPPIPGRVDYIHYLADLLTETNGGKPPQGHKVSVLDIGTGASCIYPILGQRSYAWRFVASDIDQESLDNANLIIDSNKGLKSAIKCRLQPNHDHLFNGIIAANEYFDLTMSNPPFHQSLDQAMAGTTRKWKNLGKANNQQPQLNFGGQKAELWCQGGELSFISNMINESKDYRFQVLWFSSLVSKKANLDALKSSLKSVNAAQVKVIEMAQGNKISHFIAWSFFDHSQQQAWCKARYYTQAT